MPAFTNDYSRPPPALIQAADEFSLSGKVLPALPTTISAFNSEWPSNQISIQFSTGANDKINLSPIEPRVAAIISDLRGWKSNHVEYTPQDASEEVVRLVHQHFGSYDEHISALLQEREKVNSKLLNARIVHARDFPEPSVTLAKQLLGQAPFELSEITLMFDPSNTSTNLDWAFALKSRSPSEQQRISTLYSKLLEAAERFVPIGTELCFGVTAWTRSAP